MHPRDLAAVFITLLCVLVTLSVFSAWYVADQAAGAHPTPADMLQLCKLSQLVVLAMLGTLPALGVALILHHSAHND